MNDKIPDDQTCEGYYETAVIGAGPIGLYAAYYCALRDINTIILESLPIVGGQLSSLYPNKSIVDLPGFPKIKAQEFINNLHTQVKGQPNNITMCLNTKVINVTKNKDGFFEIKSNNKGKKIFSKTIVICTGKGAFSPRTLGVDDEDNIKNLSYFLENETKKYFNKKIIVFGGGDTAIETALYLADKASEVYLIHRRDEFRAIDSNINKLNKQNTKILKPYLFHSAKVVNGYITEIILNNKVTNNTEKMINIDQVIVNFGTHIKVGFIKDIRDIDLDNKFIKVSNDSSTNIEGIYACGDICTYHNRQYQITTGLGEVVNMSAAVYKYLHPNSSKNLIR